jgi:hypothetical protein
MSSVSVVEPGRRSSVSVVEAAWVVTMAGWIELCSCGGRAGGRSFVP